MMICCKGTRSGLARAHVGQCPGTGIPEGLRQRARAAFEHEIVVSTQVLIELRAVLTRKLKPAPSSQDTRAALEALARFEVVPTNASLVLDAHELSRIERLSWFDALIVEAAIRSGCERLYSEELGQGRVFGALRVSNPFACSEHVP